MLNCKICADKLNPIFTIKVLNKYDVSYFQCSNCQFIETEEPFWLNEAYGNAITDLDIGLISRNILFQPKVQKIINTFFNKNERYVDYGGGYGIFVRLMRDSGYDFFRQDIYCQNLFAKNFDIEDLPADTSYELLTAFEVFEHLVDPVEELEKMLKLSDNIFFSTVLQPSNLKKPSDWWYFIPETGQHISLYSQKALELLGKRFSLNYYNYQNFHLFTKRILNRDKFKKVFEDGIGVRILKKLSSSKEQNRESLVKKDFDLILNNLKA